MRTEGPRVFRLLQSAFAETWSEDEFLWKYREPPLRPLDVFGAVDTASGQLAGVFSCGMREYWRAGSIVRGFQEADGAVDVAYRSRRVFSSLVDYMTRFVREQGGLFHYGFTNDMSAGAMKRSSDSIENYSNRVFARPLGSKNVVRALPIPSIGRRYAAVVAEPVIRWLARSYVARKRNDLLLEPVESFDDFPDQLAQRWSQRYSLVPRRNKEYMEWRVQRAPDKHRPNLRAYWIVRGGRRIGYTVLYLENLRNVLKIIDILCDPETEKLDRCLTCILVFALETGVDAVTTNVAGHEHHAGLKSAGFIALQPARCNVFAVSPQFSVERDLGARTWYLAPIDRDTFGGY
jgi:hypothetical protein